MELLQAGGGRSDGEQVVVDDGHEGAVAEQLQSLHVAEVDAGILEGVEVGAVLGILHLDVLQVDGHELEREQRVLTAVPQQTHPVVGGEVAQDGPWEAHGDEVGAGVQHAGEVGRGLKAVEPVDPQALDAGRQQRVALEELLGLLEGGERVAVDVATGQLGLVHELVGVVGGWSSGQSRNVDGFAKTDDVPLVWLNSAHLSEP